MRLAARRVPLLAVGLLSMACGMWLGLVRLGWNLPLPWQDQLIAHGPLMVCGFLGTLISLERAVAPSVPDGGMPRPCSSRRARSCWISVPSAPSGRC